MGSHFFSALFAPFSIKRTTIEGEFDFIKKGYHVRTYSI